MTEGKKHEHGEQGREKGFLEEEIVLKIPDVQTITIILAAGLVVVAAVSLWLVSGMSSAVPQPKPVPVVDVAKILDLSCKDCFDVEPIMQSVRNSGVKIGKEEALDFSSPRAKELIAKYGIEKIPTIIVTGETANATALKTAFASFGEERNGALVVTKQTPVYIDAGTGEAKGRISLIYLKDSACADCGDYSASIQQLKRIGMVISNESAIEYDSPAGRALIEKYNITNVPTLIFSKDAKEYGDFEKVWPQIGSIESDGTHVIRTPNPPYRDLASGEIKGRVSLITLADSECGECYDPSVHKTILTQMGLRITNESTADINSSEGKALIEKYNITAAPTVIFSPDAKEYVVLAQIWPQVGTIESDGWFVFRNMAAMSGAVYRDLASGEVVGAAGATGANATGNATNST